MSRQVLGTVNGGSRLPVMSAKAKVAAVTEKAAPAKHKLDDSDSAAVTRDVRSKSGPIAPAKPVSAKAPVAKAAATKPAAKTTFVICLLRTYLQIRSFCFTHSS